MAISSNLTQNMDGIYSFAVNRYIQKKFADAFLGHHPLMLQMKRKGKILKGGTGPWIVEQIMAPNTGGPVAQGVSDGYMTFDHAPLTNFTGAIYKMAEKLIPISWQDYDEEVTMGSEVAVAQWAENQIKMGFKLLFQECNDDLWAAEGTAGSNGILRNALGSIRTYLNRGGTSTTQAVGPTVQTAQIYNGGTEPGGIAVGTTPITLVGNIERNAANAGWWCTPVLDPNSAATLSLFLLNNLVSLASRGDDAPDIAFIGRELVDKAVTILQGAGYSNIFADVPEVMKKFNGFMYRGVYWTYDDGLPAGQDSGTSTAFVMNTDYLNLRTISMEPKTKRKDPTNSPLTGYQVTWYGQLTANHLGRVHSRHNNITTPTS